MTGIWTKGYIAGEREEDIRRRTRDARQPPKDRYSALIAMNDARNAGRFSVQMWHNPEDCTGNCPYHPLIHTQLAECFSVFETSLKGYGGKGWGCVTYDDALAELEAETPVQKAERLAREEAEKALRLIESQVIRQGAYVDEVAFRQQLKKKKGDKTVPKIPAPCKWLYAVPGKNGVFSSIPVAQCWAWKYDDARGVHNEPCKCEYMHQDEPGWKPEWNSLPCVRNRWKLPTVTAPVHPLAAVLGPKHR